MKSEGVKDVVKFLEEKVKEAKESMAAAKDEAGSCGIGGRLVTSMIGCMLRLRLGIQHF